MKSMTQEAEKILYRCNSRSDIEKLSDEDKEKVREGYPVGLLTDSNVFILGKNEKGNARTCTDSCKFYIFNLPQGPQFSCPFATWICRESCYQIGPERMIQKEGRNSPTVYRRKRNLLESLRDDFAETMIEIINHKKTGQKDVYIRIHASGDFYSEEYLLKWIEISQAIKASHPEYNFTAYTKSVNYLKSVLTNHKDKLDEIFRKYGFGPLPSYTVNDLNIHFLGSVMDDTAQSQIDLMKELGLKLYVVTRNETPDLVDCEHVDCVNCMLCYDPGYKEDVRTRLRIG